MPGESTGIVTRVAILERDQETWWKRYDDLRSDIKEHHLEDDERFKSVNARLDALNTRFTSILASICVLCISLLINAAVLWIKVGN